MDTDLMWNTIWLGQIPALCFIHDALLPVIGNHWGVAARHVRIRTFATREIESRNDSRHDHWVILVKLFDVRKDELGEINDANVLAVARSIIIART